MRSRNRVEKGKVLRRGENKSIPVHTYRLISPSGEIEYPQWVFPCSMGVKTGGRLKIKYKEGILTFLRGYSEKI